MEFKILAADRCLIILMSLARYLKAPDYALRFPSVNRWRCSHTLQHCVVCSCGQRAWDNCSHIHTAPPVVGNLRNIHVFGIMQHSAVFLFQSVDLVTLTSGLLWITSIYLGRRLVASCPFRYEDITDGAGEAWWGFSII